MREDFLQKMVFDFQEIVKQEHFLFQEYGVESPEAIRIKTKKDILYKAIEKEYCLPQRIKTWANSYLVFFDSYDDFYALCRKVFYESVVNFKSLKTRIYENQKKYKKGKIKEKNIIPKGNGELNTFFAQCLSNELVNYYNSLQAQCRNPKVRCPICMELVSPLKKHLKEDHEEYVRKAWNNQWNKHMDAFEVCPVCGVNTKSMFNHIISRHPDVIYDLFRVEYPQYMLSEIPYSLDFEYSNNEDEGNTLADLLYNQDENSIIDEIYYKHLISQIKNHIEDSEELEMFHMILNGYSRSEVCKRTNWSQEKYTKLKNNLKRNNRIKKILAIN